MAGPWKMEDPLSGGTGPNGSGTHGMENTQAPTAQALRVSPLGDSIGAAGCGKTARPVTTGAGIP